MSIKLNIGAGETRIPGFIPIDRKLGHEAYPLPTVVKHDGETVTLTDDSVDEIRASHVLEHLSWNDAKAALADWVRKLRPGGVLKVAVPDFDKIMALPANNPHRMFYMMGGQTDQDDFHRSAWTKGKLAEYLREAGLYGVEEWSDDIKDCAQLPISLNLTGHKPMDGEKEDGVEVKIRAIITLPRVTWTDAAISHANALKPFGIPISYYTSCFWHQGQQNEMERCLDDGIDWILTIDYDSMFVPAHVNTLLKNFASNSHIDALAALQTKRECEKALLGIKACNDEGTVDMPMDRPFEVDTAHFGMTLIRADALRKIPKPWFVGQPNEDGSYRKGHIDPDIFFWHKWKEHGNTLYVDPTTNIGHLEVMVSRFGAKDGVLTRVHDHVGAWREAHGWSKGGNINE